MGNSQHHNSRSAAYAAAGVDITAGYETVKRIGPLVEGTFTEEVLGGIGGFGGMFAPNLAGMARPVFVSGTDGVGTKIRLAFALERHDTIGIDCVAMCVNDIICSGARPLFFLDYLAMGKNEPDRAAAIISGIAKGCRMASAALIGGETAEMPGCYPEKEYDLAGFAVGVVDEQKIIDNAKIQAGDKLIALPSSGLHSNGYSLVRRVFGDTRADLETYIPELQSTLGDELLRPTQIYVRPILQLLDAMPDSVYGICHITGGGLYENVPRMLPKGMSAHIHPGAMPIPPIFALLQARGKIDTRDMYNTFNMGMGLMLAVKAGDADAVAGKLTQLGETPYIVGNVQKGEQEVELIW